MYMTHTHTHICTLYSSCPVTVQSYNIYDTIHESNCKKCSEYESYLCKVLDELGSAWKIIDVLQKELSTYLSSNSVCEANPVRWKASNTSAISTEWTIVPTGNQLHNQSKNNKHLITSCDQTIESTNRFMSLSNLEVVDMALHEPLELNKSTPVRTTSGINQHHHNIGFKIPT